MSLFHRKSAAAPSLPVLQSERLVLRGFDPSDAVDVYEYAQSEKVGPMAGWAPHKSLEDSRAVVDNFIRSDEVWAIVSKKTGRVIGSLGLHKRGTCTSEGSRELGYALGESHWGNGYATEACRIALDYAFTQLNCRVVRVGHFPFNQKSRRLIKKLGFVYEGSLRQVVQLPDGSWTDELMYSLLRDEYLSQSR